jgi:hypothetical protein
MSSATIFLTRDCLESLTGLLVALVPLKERGIIIWSAQVEVEGLDCAKAAVAYSESFDDFVVSLESV